MSARRFLGVISITAIAAFLAAPSGSARLLDERPEFVIVAIGDSFPSGEGSPERDGEYDNRGRLRAGGRHEFWGLDDPAKPLENQRCHRSKRAGPAVAAERLQETFPELRITFKSFACSGAKLGFASPRDGLPPEGGVLWPYRGVEAGLRAIGPMPPQIVQINQFLEARPNKSIDALVMAIGINDFGFGDIVAGCVDPRIDDCGRHTETVARMRAGARALPGLYATLAAAIDGRAAPVILSTRPRRVYLSEYPDPTHDDDGAYCDRKPRGDLFEDLIASESRWAYREALPALNGAVRTAVRRHGWSLIGGLERDFETHGVCASSRWFNSNTDALRRQGADGDIGWLADLVVDVSSGVVHPNPAGHAAWADRIVAALDGQIRTQFRLDTAPPGLTVVSVRRQVGRKPGIVRLRWTDPLAAEQRFELEIDRQRTVTLPANTIEYGHAVSGRASYRVRACGLSFCTPWSQELVASTRAPRTPRNLRRDPDRERGTIRLVWTPADGDHTRFEVRYQRTGRSRPSVRSVAGSTFVLGGLPGGPLLPTHRYVFEVRACSDVACSRWTPQLVERVGVD